MYIIISNDKKSFINHNSDIVDLEDIDFDDIGFHNYEEAKRISRTIVNYSLLELSAENLSKLVKAQRYANRIWESILGDAKNQYIGKTVLVNEDDKQVERFVVGYDIDSPSDLIILDDNGWERSSFNTYIMPEHLNKRYWFIEIDEIIKIIE